MATIREWVRRLWGALRPNRRDAELEEELRLHLDLAAEHERRRGRPVDDARRSAVIRCGAVAQSMEALRDQRGLPWASDLLRDLRYGFRTLRRKPMFTSVAVVTLALGIGANTAVFSLADAALFRTLPVAEPGALVLLHQRGPGGDIFPFTSAAADGLSVSRDVLSGLAVFRPWPSTHVSVDGEAELALTQWVSGNYHAVLGVQSIVGRTLTERDRGPVAVISHRFWQRRFAGDANAVGRVLEVGGHSFTIIGITPPEFFGTQPGRYIDVTLPLAARAETMPPHARWLYLVGRLAPGVSREQARAALRVRWAHLAAAESTKGAPPATLELDSGAQGLNELRREFSRPLQILMAAAGMVLLVACANLAGLLIVRSNTRQQEIAVRLSLGAARGRIVRQLLTEAVLLAAAGGAAGVVLARWVTELILAMMSRGRSPIVLDVAPQARTLAFAAAVTIVTAVVFGLLPAVGASRTDVQRRLKQGVTGADRTRNTWARATVGVQVALLVILLTAAGLFARTLQKVRAVDAGFHQDHVLVVRVSAGPTYGEASRRALHEDLYARFGALPGVGSVSMSMDTPPLGELSMAPGIHLPGRAADRDDAPSVYLNYVGPRFFETMGIPVLAGRDFEFDDDESTRKYVAISEGVARRYFPGDNPLGRQILVGGTARGAPAQVASVVAVVKDVRYTSLRTDAPLMIYRPYRQESSAPADTFLIRTTSSASAEALPPLLRTSVRAAAPALPAPSVVRLEEQVDAVLVEERMLAALSSAIGVLAAMLVAIGIYSIVASAVLRRQRELGIRMALGALPGQVARMVVREAIVTVATGLAIGIPVALAAAVATRGVLSDVLFDLSPTDPLSLWISAALILLLTSLAAYLPARRASRIDPVAAIRYE